MRTIGRFFAIGAVVVFLLVSTFLVSAADATPPCVGMEGRFEITIGGSALEAKPVTERSRVIIRIAETRPHGTLNYYDLRYIGLEPGNYDLRDFLLRKDGSGVADLPAMPVTVTGILPKNHHGELVETTRSRLRSLGGYKLTVIAIGVLWMGAMVPLFFLRRKKTVVQSVDIPKAAPTLADRLRPLVRQALDGKLGHDDQALIERMLLNYWRQKLGLEDVEMPEAIRRLREHPEAGALLRELENWLHRRPGSVKVDINKLLRPYENLPASEAKPLEVVS